MAEHKSKDLDWRLLRDYAAGMGLGLGAFCGLLFAMTKGDNETASYFQRLISDGLEGLSGGAIVGAGLGYCTGLAPELIYKAMKRYKIFERVTEPIYRAIVRRDD